MNDADRYNAEVEQLIRDTQADAERAENRDREAIWKRLEKSFNRMADAHKWSAEQRAVKAEVFLRPLLRLTLSTSQRTRPWAAISMWDVRELLREEADQN